MLIVGAGIAGPALAIALRRAGITRYTMAIRRKSGGSCTRSLDVSVPGPCTTSCRCRPGTVDPFVSGDAAHAIGPHVGQGASLALEDALVLAKCLRDIHDLPRAFSTFECLRRPRVEPIVKQSRRTGRQKASTGWIGRKIRDLVLPMFLKRGAHAANELYRYAVDWEARVA